MSVNKDISRLSSCDIDSLYECERETQNVLYFSNFC